MNILKFTKYRNILKNSRVAVVIDDLKTVDPWDPRGIRIYGVADSVESQGGYMDQTGRTEYRYIRIRPIKKWSWGIDGPIFTDGKFHVKRNPGKIDTQHMAIKLLATTVYAKEVVTNRLECY